MSKYLLRYLVSRESDNVDSVCFYLFIILEITSDHVLAILLFVFLLKNDVFDSLSLTFTKH